MADAADLSRSAAGTSCPGTRSLYLTGADAMEPTAMIDPITENDLTAFVDGQLDGLRRLDVESYLARHPETAALIMAELHDRDALRQAFAGLPGPGPERNRVAARRLDRTLAWRRFGDRLRRAAVIALLVGTGWLAHSDGPFLGVPDTFASPVDPALVADARHAREAAQIRTRIASQRALAGSYDRDGITAATGIALPDLPADWTVRDVQVVPARNGTGVEVVIDAGTLGEVSLFATRGSEIGVTPSAVTSPGDGETAYWTAARTAYALSGGRDHAGLGDAARRLAGQGATKL
jgi:anti-sigma factor RsiW